MLHKVVDQNLQSAIIHVGFDIVFFVISACTLNKHIMFGKISLDGYCN